MQLIAYANDSLALHITPKKPDDSEGRFKINRWVIQLENLQHIVIIL
jgi:hypothetical protein